MSSKQVALLKKTEHTLGVNHHMLLVSYHIRVTYPIYACLRSLLQRVKHNVQVLLELGAESQSNVTKH